MGSGNIGATNVWRVYGRRLGVSAVILDTAKGFVPAFVATKVAGHDAACSQARAAMLGHYRPLFLGFKKGGKMVATTGGAFLGVAPIVGGLRRGVWLVVFGLTRYASVASIAPRSRSALGLARWLSLAGDRLRGGRRARGARPPSREPRRLVARRGAAVQRSGRGPQPVSELAVP